MLDPGRLTSPRPAALPFCTEGRKTEGASVASSSPEKPHASACSANSATRCGTANACNQNSMESCQTS
jgi:hypothetical protein